MKRIVPVIFSIFIIFGLFCGILYTINLNLNSDTVVPGLVAMEIFRHGNLQYNFPADDPYIFTDVYTFYLVPQFLSGFNPTVLRLTAFFIFILAVAVFSYIVYKYSGLTNALILAAFLVNLSPAAYSYFISPELHVGTLLATGVLLILFDFDRVKDASYYRILAYIVFAMLILLSDSLLLAMFIVPYVACYLFFYRAKIKKNMPGKKIFKRARSKNGLTEDNNELENMDALVILMVFVSAIVWLFKNYEPSFIWPLIYFNPVPTSLSGLNQALAVNLPLYFRSLSLLVNQGLFNVLSLQISLLDIPMAIFFLAALYMSIKRTNGRAKYLYRMFLLSGVTLFLGFVFLDRAGGSSSARYLIYTAVSVFVAIALAYSDDISIKKPNVNTIFLIAIVLLILLIVPCHVLHVSSLDFQPNRADYDLIGYLTINNLTHGYSDYWGSNVLTYLSSEEVEIRPVQVVNDFEGNSLLRPAPWLGTSRWYTAGFNEPVIIADNGTDDDFYNGLQPILKQDVPQNTYHYKNFTIYKYNGTL